MFGRHMPLPARDGIEMLSEVGAAGWPEPRRDPSLKLYKQPTTTGIRNHDVVS